MPLTTHQPSRLKLSICITTFNRAAFIGATLESILTQATSECEVVVLDGASTDETERVVSEYAQRFNCLRYIRQQTNNGIDRDYDRAVELARGSYCWLMTDDDLLKPSAVATILQALRHDLSLLIVNVETWDVGMSSILQRRGIDFESDRVYRSEEMERLFVEIGYFLSYIGSVVIKREIWRARERERYYGSLFTYFAVIFQDRLPGDTLLIVEPLIKYRMGNTRTFSSRIFETFMVSWPSVVWSLKLPESAKSKVCSAEPWRNLHMLLLWRGLGFYSYAEFRRWIRPRLSSFREALAPALIALLPGVAVNALFVLYFSVTRHFYQGVWQSEFMLQALRVSRFYPPSWRVLKQEVAGS